MNFAAQIMIIIRLTLWLIVLGALALLLAAWFGLEDTPLVTESPNMNVSDIQSARDVLKQYDPRNLPDDRNTTMVADRGQINTALAGTLSSVPQLKARIMPSRFGLLVKISGKAPIPDNPFGRYVNIRMVVKSSAKGLKMGRFSIGKIEVPTAIVRRLLILLIDQAAGPRRGKAFLESIRSLQVTGNQIRIVFRPKDSLLEERKITTK